MKPPRADWSEQPEDWHEPEQAELSIAKPLIIYALIIVFVAAMLGWFFAGQARAHHVPDTDGLTYDKSCCNSAATHPTGDCAPVDDQYVSERADGYHISIPVGEHPKLTDRGYSAVIPYRDKSVRNPLDNRYHICLATNGHVRFCFHPKPGAV